MLLAGLAVTVLGLAAIAAPLGGSDHRLRCADRGNGSLILEGKSDIWRF